MKVKKVLTSKEVLKTTLISALSFLFFTSSASASEADEVSAASDKAYVILGARNEASEHRQPTWVGLKKRRNMFHANVADGITELRPGRYKVDHFDFGNKEPDQGSSKIEEAIRKDSIITRDHTMIHGGDRLAFDLEAGKIYVMGNLILGRDESGETFRVEVDNRLLAVACRAMPEVFTTHPVHFLFHEDPNKGYKISCDFGDEESEGAS